MEKDKKVLPVGRGKLRRWILNNGLTMTKFAKEMGITRTYLNMVMTGVRRPSKKLIMQIRDFTVGKVKYFGDILDKQNPSSMS
jgi:transcriptional regulator with XRE-family HTH domain